MFACGPSIRLGFEVKLVDEPTFTWLLLLMVRFLSLLSRHGRTEVMSAAVDTDCRQVPGPEHKDMFGAKPPPWWRMEEDVSIVP